MGVPNRPWKHGIIASIEMSIEAAVGHQLVDEKQLAASMAPTDKLHEILVAKPAYDPYLSFLPCLEPLETLLMST